MLDGPDRGPAVGEGQLQTDAAGARPDVPDRLAGADSQGGQHLRPDGLLGHRHSVRPGKGVVRPAGGAGGQARRGLGQQHRQGRKAAPRHLAGRPGGDALAGQGQLLPHRHRQVSQAGGGELPAQAGGARRPAAGQEKDRRAAADGGHRVAGRAVGRDQLPPLPGAAEGRRQQLYAGEPRRHPGGDAPLFQKVQQAGRAGIKAGVPAVEGGGRPPGGQQGVQHVGRADSRQAAGRILRRQSVQQALRPRDADRPPEGRRPLGGEGCGRRPHPHQGDVIARVLCFYNVHSCAAFLHRARASP